MQTFLPYPDFAKSAAVLDDRRLGKQRVETLQMIRALTRETYGWKRHPAVRMWTGHVEALAAYGATVCAEWVRRGYADTCAATMSEDLRLVGIMTVRDQSRLAAAGLLPSWLGEDRVHASHQAALLRKDTPYYGAHFAGVDADQPYVWPVPRDAAEVVTSSPGEG